MTNLNRKIIWAVLLGVGVMLGLTFLADFRAAIEALSRFNVLYLPLILGLTFINYTLRFIKWHYYLRLIKVQLPLKESFRIFLSGLAMSITPGKAGELLKSLLLKELTGTPVSRTAPVIFAERLTDGFGLIILSLTGMAMFKHGTEVLLFISLILAVMVVIIKTPRLHRLFIGLCSRVPVARKFTGVFEILFSSAGELMAIKPFLLAISISVISWGFESVAFYLVFIGLGFKVSFVAAAFTLAFSSIVASVSMLPGGLGAAETSIMGLLVKVVGVPAGTAAVATIIIRFCTLWFGVTIGLLAIASNRRVIKYVNKMGNAAEEKGAAQ